MVNPVQNCGISRQIIETSFLGKAYFSPTSNLGKLQSEKETFQLHVHYYVQEKGLFSEPFRI
jgi:hypothetical protein